MDISESQRHLRITESYSGCPRLAHSEKWRWAHYDPKAACAQLNSNLSLRGEIVHQSRQSDYPKNAHVVRREDVDKAIRFIKGLVVSQSS